MEINSANGLIIEVMSWIFGMGGNKPEPPNLEDIAGVSDKKPSPPPSSSSGEAYKFDSSALERAAQAAKELEKSSRYLLLVINFMESINICSNFYFLRTCQGSIRFS